MTRERSLIFLIALAAACRSSTAYSTSAIAGKEAADSTRVVALAAAALREAVPAETSLVVTGFTSDSTGFLVTFDPGHGVPLVVLDGIPVQGMGYRVRLDRDGRFLRVEQPRGRFFINVF